MDNKVPQQINDIVGDNVKKLAQLFPSAVKDGEVDFEALKEELGQFEEVGSEKYELTWAGKKNAKKIAQEDVIGRTLKYIPEDSKDADTTENLYIEGDNLEVLKLLRQNYYGAIKMIYIDPPYNTGNDFVYNDSFVMSQEESDVAEEAIDELGERYTINKNSQNRYHANWLNMMYPRLKIACDLLKDSGVIFISIDDSEVANLRKICDEIFGADNFIANLIWQKKFSRANDAKYFSTMHDHILCYCKNKDATGWQIGLLPRGDEIPSGYSNPDNDPRGLWTSVILSAKSGSSNLIYEIETPSGRKVMPPSGRFWSCNQETFERWSRENRIWYGKDGAGTPRKKTFLSEVQNGLRPNTLLFQDEVGNNQEAKQETKVLFDGIGVFDGPKPVRLLEMLIRIANISDDDIVLDFFSGSATTAHSIMSMNASDRREIRYILVQLPERCNNISEAYKAGYHDICEIGKERIRRAGDKIKSEHPDADIDIGFKVFRTADKNIKWNSLMNTGKIDINQMETSPDTIDFMLGAKDVDIVYELMLRQNDVPLSSKMEKICVWGGYERTYLYADSYLVCLETKITNELIDKLAEIDPLPIKFIFRDSAFQDNIALKDETFRRLKALIEKNHGMKKMAYTVEFL